MAARRSRVVLVTAPSGAKAERLARGLVEARLAACVNVVPRVASHYRWKGKLERAAEALLVVKTVAGRVPALERWLEANHPYDVFELLSLAVDAGAAPYLGWLAEETR